MAETAKTARAVEPRSPFPKPIPKPRAKAHVEPSMDESAPLLIRANTLGMFPLLSDECEAAENESEAADNQTTTTNGRTRKHDHNSAESDSDDEDDDDSDGDADVAGEASPQRPRKISRKHSLMYPVSSLLLHTTSSLDLITEPADTHVFDQEGDGPDDHNSENEAEHGEAIAGRDRAKTNKASDAQENKNGGKKDDAGDDDNESEDCEVRHAKTMSGGVTTIEASATDVGEEEEEDLKVREEAPDAVNDDDDDDDDDDDEDDGDGNNEDEADRSDANTSKFLEPVLPAPARPGPITRRESFKDASQSSWRVF